MFTEVFPVCKFRVFCARVFGGVFLVWFVRFQFEVLCITFSCLFIFQKQSINLEFSSWFIYFSFFLAADFLFLVLSSTEVLAQGSVSIFNVIEKQFKHKLILNVFFFISFYSILKSVLSFWRFIAQY